LNQAMKSYEKTEKRICLKGNINGRLPDVLSSLLNYTDKQLDGLLDRFKDIADFLNRFKDGTFGDKSWKDLILFAIDAPDIISDWVDGIKDDIVDATTWKGEADASWQYWGAGVEGEYGSAGVAFLAASAYASAEAGLMTKDDDGNLIFNPHIDAQAGASFTVLQADAQASVGNEMLGANGNASVTVGKVSGEAEMSVGLFDEDGNIDPRLHAGVNAEAIAVEAKAEAGVTVLGTEAKVEAGVNVGIGAHADAGYEDGVFSFSVGASLGIGASVAFEVDVGGTIDAIKDFSLSKLFGKK